MRRKNFEVVFL